MDPSLLQFDYANRCQFKRFRILNRRLSYSLESVHNTINVMKTTGGCCEATDHLCLTMHHLKALTSFLLPEGTESCKLFVRVSCYCLFSQRK